MLAVSFPTLMANTHAKVSRLFVDADLSGDNLRLEKRDAHYIGNVLRRHAGDALIVFNGRGDERHASVETTGRRGFALELQERITPLPESNLALTLIQAAVKNDAMDLIVQKATELGVRNIHAVTSEFSVVRLDETRAVRRFEHWRRIVVSACEQSGRHFLPTLKLCSSLAACLAELPEQALRVVLHPGGATHDAPRRPGAGDVCLLVGPEGGWSAADLETIAAAGFTSVRLGTRTLRAETAAVAACALAQARWGDLGPW